MLYLLHILYFRWGYRNVKENSEANSEIPFYFSINSAKYSGNQYTYLCADFVCNCKTILQYFLDHHTDYLHDCCYQILCKFNRKDNDCRTKMYSTYENKSCLLALLKERNMTNIEYLQTYVYNHAMSKFDSITSDFVRGNQICQQNVQLIM